DQVFKDAASVTRIIDLLIKKNYLEREAHDQDRRRFKLQLTKEGKELLKSLQKIVNQNRAIALEGIDDENLKLTRETLLNIIDNCQKSE
ncbi:MAG: MarR family transcriptional regulator, partial [Flavisolibacter sp.]|nr:MarR family transcriptional regulator [Flavisolibacter sp.]